MAQLQRETEIRNLSVSTTQEIAKILDVDDSILSLLMGSIVKDLDNSNSELRFTSRDVDSIRNYSKEIRKSAILIFLDEWSTMGKSRPKLRHLLEILTRCQLFRAADYLANLIGEPSPERPQTGPAARIDIDLDIEDVVNGLESPSGADVNRNKPVPKPEIIAPNMHFPTASASNNNGSVSLPLIPVPSNRYTNSTIFAPSTGTTSKNPPVSDLIKFPSSRQPSENFLPDFNALRVSEQIPVTVNTEQTVVSQSNIPAFSGLMGSEDTPTQSSELPAILTSVDNPQNPSSNSTPFIPMFSDLINGETTSHSRSQISTQSAISSSDSE